MDHREIHELTMNVIEQLDHLGDLVYKHSQNGSLSPAWPYLGGAQERLGEALINATTMTFDALPEIPDIYLPNQEEGTND